MRSIPSGHAFPPCGPGTHASGHCEEFAVTSASLTVFLIAAVEKTHWHLPVFPVSLLPFPRTLVIFSQMESTARPVTARNQTARPMRGRYSHGQPSKGVSPSMAKGKPLFKQTDIKRALDAARKMNVRVRSVDIKRDGSLSLVLDNRTNTDTDPVTTITESELKELI